MTVHLVLQDSHSRKVIAGILKRSVCWLTNATSRKRHALSGKTLVITGTLSSMAREDAKERSQALEAKVAEEYIESARQRCSRRRPNVKSIQGDNFANPED
jgi:NAD-dependent DNA ligase